ncbi:MAG TPA: DUF4335 domain-containing protein [Nostocaceae cyanobacterium]|nr:DUF4335 domain-containing protein [Nostocaceae cyanobacterium]
MPRSNSVIRRYTPPTCTLEILAQSSPLSQLMGKTVLKQLRFQLHFDDPRLPEEQKIIIKGDRNQLEALCDAVTTYVQELLQKSADSFWVSITDSPELNGVLGESTSPDAGATKTLNSTNTKIPDPHIYLEASSQLTHKLNLGSLANQSSGPAIKLTLLQLFDLASALDEYAADVMALPNLEQNTFEWKLPSWAPVAAVLVLAVGLTPITWQYAHNFNKNQSQVAKKVTPSEEKVAIQPTPSLNIATPQPALTPTENLKSLPNLTTPIPAAKLPPAPQSFPNPTIPPIAQGTTQPPLSANPAFTIPTSTRPQDFRQNSRRVVAKRPPLEIAQSGITIPNTTTWPATSSNIPSSTISIPPQPVASLPQRRTSNPQPILPQPELPTTDATIQPPAAAPSTPLNDAFAAKLPAPTQPNAQGEVATQSTLFDTPQVAEAREFLKQKWQPPEGFSDTLEYSLILDVDGSIARILPLNQAARVHIDMTGIPEIGKPFVSANKNGQNIRLRAVFNPDGKVQTFPESQ